MVTLVLRFLVALCFLYCVCRAAEVTQEKRMVTGVVGGEVVIPCHHNDPTYLAMLWYQQKKETGLKLIASSVGQKSGDVEDKENEKKWALERPDILKSFLTIRNLEVQDSAVFFCAAGDIGGGAALYFGPGTVLHVLENGEERKQPEVKVYRPNKKEFKEHNLISLVCVANGFYPEHVRLHWYMNGIKRDNIYPNVPQLNSDNKTYFTSKRLSLTRSEYFNPQNTFKCVAGFIDDESGKINDEIMGEADCSVSREQYGMSINQGKISYIMVMCKSGLYGIIVLFIIWRRKVIAASK